MAAERERIIRASYEAFNSRNVDELRNWLHPDFHVELASSMGFDRGRYVGEDGLRRFFESYWDAFDSITIEVEELIDGDEATVAIIRALQERGAKIIAHDPAAMDEAKKVLKEVTYADDPYAVADGSDAIILMTEWNPFRNLDLDQIKKKLKSPIFIDLRNVYEPKKMAALGFKYTSVGRPS